jgi:hypothetical protein
MIDWTLVLAALSLEVVIISSAVGVVWKLSRSEMALRAEFVKELSAISAKVYQVEIWSRDEFVRKGSFETIIARMEKGFGDLRSEIASRLDRMTDRIEHLNSNSPRD